MLVGDITDEVKLMLKVNRSQLNDDIAPSDYRLFAQQAYESLWSDIRTEVSEANLLVKDDIQWNPAHATMTLPAPLQDKLIWDIWQLGPDGTPWCPANICFETRNTLRMGIGPVIPANLGLRIYYVPDAEAFVDDKQTPLLIPTSHHRVIVWKTLVDIKMLWDKDVPQSWEARLDKLTGNLLQELRTRPVAHRANIKPRFRTGNFGGLAGAIL
jgi:hypothetical protein